MIQSGLRRPPHGGHFDTIGRPRRRVRFRMLTRRDWMRTAGLVALGAGSRQTAEVKAYQGTPAAAAPGRSAFCFFSKHLPDLGWSDLGKAVKDAGFDGVDL